MSEIIKIKNKVLQEILIQAFFKIKIRKKKIANLKEDRKKYNLKLNNLISAFNQRSSFSSSSIDITGKPFKTMPVNHESILFSEDMKHEISTLSSIEYYQKKIKTIDDYLDKYYQAFGFDKKIDLGIVEIMVPIIEYCQKNKNLEWLKKFLIVSKKYLNEVWPLEIYLENKNDYDHRWARNLKNRLINALFNHYLRRVSPQKTCKKELKKELKKQMNEILFHPRLLLIEKVTENVMDQFLKGQADENINQNLIEERC